MQQDEHGGIAPENGIDWSLLAPLLLQAALLQIGVQLARVNITYSAISLELSVLWIGIIAASFALLPAIFAMQIGRFSDRYGDAVAATTGTALVLVACAGLWLAPAGEASLVVFSTVLGLALTFCLTGQQSLSARCAGPAHRDSVFGHYMLTVSVGQALGSMVLSHVAAGADIPPIGEVFFYTVVISDFALALAVLLHRRAGSGGAIKGHSPMPLKDLLRVRGLLAMAIASALVATSIELTVIYLPLIGSERAINASTIGYMLALRAGGSIVARAVYAPLVRMLGRMRLMFMVMAGASASLALAAFPVPVWLLFGLVTAIGFFLAIASTASLTALIDLAPKEARGAALAVRQTCNRTGQFVTPMVVSLVAVLTGAGAVFAILALAIGASGAVADRAMKQRDGAVKAG